MSIEPSDVKLSTSQHIHYTFNQLPIDSNKESDVDALKSLFRIALDTRNFEIGQLVHRNNFFMLFQGVLLAGVAQSEHSIPVVSFMICLAGLIVSIYQTSMASGAKFWQEYWEYALHETEARLLSELKLVPNREQLLSFFHDEMDVYKSRVKKRMNSHSCSCGLVNKLIMAKFSVSKIPIYVGISLSIIWFLLLLCTIRGYAPLSIPSFIVGF